MRKLRSFIRERALEGHEAQLGKEHEYTKRCAHNLAACFGQIGFKLRDYSKLRKIIDEYPHIMIDEPKFKNY